MNSIRNKIISAFGLIIFIFVILVTVTVVIEFGLINKFKQTNEVIVYEQLLKTEISLLAEYGYNAFKTSDYSQYDSKLKEVNSILLELDSHLSSHNIDNETNLAYRSLKNSFKIVVENYNIVRQQLEKTGDIIGITSAFTEANSKFEYVKQNIDHLLIIETSNISKASQEIERVQSVFTPISIVLVNLIIIILIIFSYNFAKIITNPIISLSKTVSKIIEGKPDITVNKKLLEQRDEIGELAVSFNVMFNKLNEKIEQMKLSEKKLMENSSKLKEQAEESSKMNKLMVGRELKMIQLKEEINELKSKLENKT